MSPFTLLNHSVFIGFPASYFSEVGRVFSRFFCLVVLAHSLLAGPIFPAHGIFVPFHTCSCPNWPTYINDKKNINN